jgi:eukaryotic-like serine/threonine-protein kinase
VEAFEVAEEVVRALEPGAVINGRYRVLRCIKSGGMGVVYEVADANTRRRLALKTLRPGVVPDSALLGRFEQEASITASFDSEHLVKVEDFGIDSGKNLVFFTMDLLAGRDLDTVLKEEGPLAPERVAHLLWQVALALSAIHDAGIVHRDLKPENLFLKRRDDDEDLVKILDFGVAKVLESDPKTTAFVGTPLYMPPEQLRGEQPDARTDVYALGQVAFTLLTGHAYLERGHIEEPASQRAVRFGVSLPRAFDDWFEQATAVKIAQRFDTATELVLGLFQALGLELPRARRGPVVGAGVALSPAGIANGSHAELNASRTLVSGHLGPSALENQSTVAVSGGSRAPARGVGMSRVGVVLGLVLVSSVVIFVWLRRPEPATERAAAAIVNEPAALQQQTPPPQSSPFVAQRQTQSPPQSSPEAPANELPPRAPNSDRATALPVSAATSPAVAASAPRAKRQAPKLEPPPRRSPATERNPAPASAPVPDPLFTRH